MFVLTTIADTLRVPGHMLAVPTLVALHKEIDLKFPGRVLMDVGLVISRYGECLKITNGTCVPGDGGSHHECLFRLVVFRPFVEEVLVGTIVKSTAEGVQVSIGFFQDIFIPTYWMLRPSHYDESTGLWVWTPDYDESNEEEGGDGENDDSEDKAGEAQEIKTKEETSEKDVAGSSQDGEAKDEKEEAAEEEKGDRFEMEIGAEIRFKVKSIQFTQVTKTAKGVQATTTTTDHSHSFPKEQEEKTTDKPLRKRSLSVDLSDASDMPPSMYIVASICEDGLGLTSWWTSPDEEEEEEEEAPDDDQEGGDEGGEEIVDGDEEVVDEEYMED